MVVILVIVFALTLNILISAKKGYTAIFGTASLAVKTDSMKGDRTDSFDAGDLIFIKVLNDQEKMNLQVGDVITFYDYIGGAYELNTHRIIAINDNNGSPVYTTKGDNADGVDVNRHPYTEVIGKYSNKWVGFGKVVTFVNSPAGFAIFVVLPSILIVIYCAYLVVKNVKEKNKAENDAVERERMKEEVRLELLREQGIDPNAAPKAKSVDIVAPEQPTKSDTSTKPSGAQGKRSSFDEDDD